MNTHKPQVCYKHVFNKFLLNSIRNKEQTKIKKTVSADYGYSKSMMIYDFLMRKSTVTLITRPRRFGKTINMSMMSSFFDITKDSKEIFKDTKIVETEYISEMN